MKYKVGDKVRISKCNVEILKGQIDVIEEVYPHDNSYKLSRFDIRIAESNLRPAEFKIWCETEEEKQAVLEELEKEGYVWYNSKEKPTEKDLLTPVGILVWKTDFENDTTITYTKSIENFDKKEYCQFTPSEFTGLDFSHKSKKIIIEQTKTGAKATYKDKWSYVEGDFENASRQALAEVLCPFKVGDRVIGIDGYVGRVKKIEFENHRKNTVYVDGWDCNSSYSENELRPYTEPLYNAKLFCVEGYGVFKQGVVYTVENGIFIGVHGSHFKDLEDINTNLASQFMEVKGGLDD